MRFHYQCGRIRFPYQYGSERSFLIFQNRHPRVRGTEWSGSRGPMNTVFNSEAQPAGRVFKGGPACLLPEEVRGPRP
jgi:hypothetical protein